MPPSLLQQITSAIRRILAGPSLPGVDSQRLQYSVYVRCQCPVRRCHSTRVPVIHSEPIEGTDRKIRSHKCLNCGECFETLEIVLFEPVNEEVLA